jgi:NADH dehydrogenase
MFLYLLKSCTYVFNSATQFNQTNKGIVQMINIPSIPGKKRIIIVGGGFGGLEMAKQLHNSNYQVVLLDKNNYHTFQPLLYQVATSGLEASAISSPYRKILEGLKGVSFRMAEVLEILPTQNKVITNEGEVSYDYLVIATGTTTNYYGMKDVEENAMPLKNIPDALNFRSLILQNLERAVNYQGGSDEQEKLIDIVIVGGGPTGVEMAGALAELKTKVLPADYPELNFSLMDINLVESNERLLASMSEEASAKTREFIEAMGVKVYLKTALKSYDGHVAVLSNGKEILTTSLIFAAGVKGAVIPGLSPESVGRGFRYHVDQNLKVQGYDNIFAVGDIAAFVPQGADRPLPMMAPVAIQMGDYLVEYLKGTKKDGFVYKDNGSMATIGKNKAVVDLPKFKFQGFFAWVVWMFVHLISIIGFRNKMRVLITWMVAYFNSDKKYRMIYRPFQREKKSIDLPEENA